MELQRLMKLSPEDANMNGYNSGLVSFSNGMYSLSLNAGISDSAASLTSRDLMIVRSGIKNRLRFTVSFGIPTTGLIQKIGLFCPEFGFGIGYNGTSFGTFVQDSGTRFAYSMSVSGTNGAGTFSTLNLSGQDPISLAFSGAVPGNIGTSVASWSNSSWDKSNPGNKGPYVMHAACSSWQLMSYFEKNMDIPSVTQGSSSSIGFSYSGSAGTLPNVSWTPVSTSGFNMNGPVFFELVYSGNFDDIEVNIFNKDSMTFIPLTKINSSRLPDDFCNLIRFPPFQAAIYGTGIMSGSFDVYNAECFMEASNNMSQIKYVSGTGTRTTTANSSFAMSYYTSTVMNGSEPPSGGPGNAFLNTLNSTSNRLSYIFYVNPTSMNISGNPGFNNYVGAIPSETTNTVTGTQIWADVCDIGPCPFINLGKAYKIKQGDLVVCQCVSNVSGTTANVAYDFYQEY